MSTHVLPLLVSKLRLRSQVAVGHQMRIFEMNLQVIPLYCPVIDIMTPEPDHLLFPTPDPGLAKSENLFSSYVNEIEALAFIKIFFDFCCEQSSSQAQILAPKTLRD